MFTSLRGNGMSAGHRSRRRVGLGLLTNYGRCMCNRNLRSFRSTGRLFGIVFSFTEVGLFEGTVLNRIK